MRRWLAVPVRAAALLAACSEAPDPDGVAPERCRLGQVVERRTYDGDHAGVLAPSFPDMPAWMDDRMDGVPAVSGCP